MYGAHIQSTERYYITQATIKKNELEKVAITSSRFIKNAQIRQKYIRDIKENAENLNNEIRKYSSVEIKKQILAIMEDDLNDLKYQEQVLQYNNYTQYVAIEIQRKSETLDVYDYVLKGIGFVVGGIHVFLGASIFIVGNATIIGAPVATLAGATLLIHGFGNLDENGGSILYNDPNYKGFVRKGYEGVFESLGYEKSTGSLVYGGVDLLLSGYGLYMGVLRKDAWKLFYYINTDYVHSYQQASGFSLLFEAVADSVTIKSAYDVYNDPEYGNKN